jgi:thiol-disulfide isomerase/thioredoxin
MRQILVHLVFCAAFLAAAVVCVASLPAQTVLLDFSESWCGPCQQMAPTVDRLASEGYTVTKIDVDAQRALADSYGVHSIPTFIVVEQGREVDRVTGATTLERLKLHLRKPAVKAESQGQPHPAWRYVEPKGYFSAVVRISCKISEHEGCLGSGVLVKWGGRIVVLTAKHVIADAKSIVVTLSTGKKHKAKVLVTSAWDCAVLQLDGRVEGVTPAQIVNPSEANFTSEARFESVGFGGPETKLACNTGLFLGFKRGANAHDDRDDWFEISGPARQGDSGGPIFSRGKVIGILWGTDGSVVVGVQAGRLGIALNESAKYFRQQSTDGTLVPVIGLVAARNPSPVPEPEPCDPNSGCCPAAPAQVDQDGSMMPWRKGIEGKIGNIDQNQAAINRKLDELLKQGQTPPAMPPSAESPPSFPTVPPPAVAPPVNAENPIEKLTDKELQWLSKHGLPLTRNLANKFSEQIEHGTPLQEKGATIFGIVLVCIATVVGLILAVLALVLPILLGHAIYTKCHADKAKIDADLQNVPGIGGALATGFDKLDTFNTQNVDPKIQDAIDKLKAGVADAQAKASAALHVGTAAALAAPAGPAASAAAAAATVTT